MAAAAYRPPPALRHHLTCSNCNETLREPVTTNCGHSLCKTCIQSPTAYSDNNCPQCKQYRSNFPDVTIFVKDVVHQLQSPKFQGRAGEVACDICVDAKLRAEKSCLVCLTSYCSKHLENHRSVARLSSHRLVEPVANLGADQRICSTHGRPLELYSRSQQRTLCVGCIEGHEQVVSIEEESNNKRAELPGIKRMLQQRIETRGSNMGEIEGSLERCMGQLESEWRDIEGVFRDIFAIVEEAQNRALEPLRARRERLEREAAELTEMLQAEIQTMVDTISNLDHVSTVEDDFYFLQSYPDLENTNNISETVDGHLDESLIFGTLRKITSNMLEEIQQKLENLTALELRRIPQFSVDVKLDPATAHRRLLVSDDRKEVRDTGVDQEVLDSPERFNVFVSVVGLNRLYSGRAYWEVEVANKTGWDVGVASVRAQRRGNLTLNPDNGYWMTVHYDGVKYGATADPPALLRLSRRPVRVGVFVDYDQGLVSFYDVTARAHIYSFNQRQFHDELVPYFSPHLTEEQNADPLIVFHSHR